MSSSRSFRTDHDRIDHQMLVEHSFDLIHFPMYLNQRVPPLVRADVIDGAADADLVAYFFADGGAHLCGYLVLNADEHGVSTKTDEFFSVIHLAFQRLCPVTATYLGFARCGPPVYAPLLALAALYKQYWSRRVQTGRNVADTVWIDDLGFSNFVTRCTGAHCTVEHLIDQARARRHPAAIVATIRPYGSQIMRTMRTMRTMRKGPVMQDASNAVSVQTKFYE